LLAYPYEDSDPQTLASSRIMLLEVYGTTTFLAACKLRWRSYSYQRSTAVTQTLLECVCVEGAKVVKSGGQMIVSG
jgi:hypothetical protein